MNKTCEHEYRVWGTRPDEDINIPVYPSDSKPEGYYGGWVICDKCGDNPSVARYEITHTKPTKWSVDLSRFGRDHMVKIIKYKN